MSYSAEGPEIGIDMGESAGGVVFNLSGWTETEVWIGPLSVTCMNEEGGLGGRKLGSELGCFGL